MQGPADTVNYMIAGYLVIFGLLAGYIASLVLRWRARLDEKKLLDEIIQEGQHPDKPGE